MPLFISSLPAMRYLNGLVRCPDITCSFEKLGGGERDCPRYRNGFYVPMDLLISEYYLAPARLRLARISNVKICKYGFA